MSRLIIYTQVFENYAYEAGQPDHWKAKGGCEYSLVIPEGVVGQLTETEIETLFQTAVKAIEKNNRFYREHVIGQPEILQPGQLTESEQEQMDYYGEITYPAEEIII